MCAWACSVSCWEAMRSGSLAGAMAAPRLARRIEASRLYVWGLILAGLGIVVFSRTTSFDLALAVYFVVAIPIGVINTLMGPMAIKSIPPEQLGRSVAFLGIFPTVAQLVATAFAGWLVSSVLRGLHVRFAGMTFGPVDTVFTAGGLLILIVGLVVWRPIFAGRAVASAPLSDHVSSPPC